MNKAIKLALLIFLAAPLVNADARITNNSKFRKVKNGVGNCIFSNRVLGFRKEGRYRLKTRFQEPESVHVRCYYPKTLGEYSSRKYGKIENSLMGMKSKLGKGARTKNLYL